MKKIISLCLVAIMLLSAMVIGVSADPTVSVWNGTDVSTSLSGTGAEADPYLIQSAADLKYLANTVNAANAEDSFAGQFAGKYFKQTVDIDLANNEWAPIGQTGRNASFRGWYDGDGHTIKGLKVTTDVERQGLFGSIGIAGDTSDAPFTADCGLSNLTVEGDVTCSSTASGKFWAGLIGRVNYDKYLGTAKVYVTNVTSNVNVTLTNIAGSMAGGITALANGAVFTNVVNNGNVSLTNTNCYIPTGGFAGRAENASFEKCVNNGDITFKTSKTDNQIRVAGLVGQMYKKDLNQTLTFTNCVNNGDVYAESTSTSSGVVVAGGIFGTVWWNCGGATDTWTDGTTKWRNYEITLTNCANTGTITAKSPVESRPSAGGMIGTTYAGNNKNDNDGGFTLVGCANIGTIVCSTEARCSGLVGPIWNSGTANFGITVKNCVTSGALTAGIVAIDWEEAYEGSEGDNLAAAQKRVRAIVGGNANTGDNFTIVVAMVAVLALGTAFVVSKKVTVRAR